MLKDLEDREYATAYLAACLKDDYPGTFFLALRHVVQAQGSVAEVAKKLNLNRWLLRSGWAFPAFYNSMTPTEIRAILKESEPAKKNRLGVWALYSAYVASLNWGLIYRKEFAREEKQKLISATVQRSKARTAGADRPPAKPP